jgi:hypothetical protein
MTRPFLHYDQDKGWSNTNPGWYTMSFHLLTHEKHEEIVEWMYEVLANPERHVRWFWYDYNASYRFRYEKEYVWFKLRWS